MCENVDHLYGWGLVGQKIYIYVSPEIFPLAKEETEATDN